MMLKASAVLVSMLAFNASAEETWRSEIMFAHVADDGKDGTKTSALFGGADLFFAPLPLDPSYPYAEAQFMERIGSVGVDFATAKFESADLEKSSYRTAGGNLTLMRPDIDFVASASFDLMDVSNAKIKETTASVKIESDTLRIGLGYFVQKTLGVRIDYKERTSTYKYTPAGIPRDTLKHSTTELSGHYLGELGGGNFYAVDAGLSRIDDKTNDEQNVELALSGVYYPDKRQGILFGVVNNKGDDKSDEGTTLSVGYEAFVATNWRILASFDRFKARDSAQGEDMDTLIVGVTARF